MKYRVGRKRSRALLNENGLEVALFHKGQEQLAQRVCDLINGVSEIYIVTDTDDYGRALYADVFKTEAEAVKAVGRESYKDITKIEL